MVLKTTSIFANTTVIITRTMILTTTMTTILTMRVISGEGRQIKKFEGGQPFPEVATAQNYIK